MSDCGVCISTGDYFDGTADVYQSDIRKARKPHKCCECNEAIKVGDKYEYYSILFDGRWTHHNTCLICMEIGEAFCCDGRLFGELWSGFDESEVWPALTTSCFDKLQTPEAKEELRRRWMQWKGLKD